MKTLCIYHGNCADGFGAALAVHLAPGYTDTTFYEALYGEEPPEVDGGHVIIVDFSYPRESIIKLSTRVDTITILDHHKTAAEQLVDLPANVHVVFDMERSGAVMAWEFFHPRTPVPRLIKHVQDRDLWRFDLEGTREIMACVLSHPYEFETWFRLLDTDPAELRAEGVAIRRNHDKQVAALVRDGVHATTIAGHRVPAVNAPGFFASDVGDIIGCGQPFAAVYSDDGEYRKYSLRSDADGLDVSKIAGFFGGGGHKHAAGFRVLLRAVGQIGDPQPSLYFRAV